jgi:eukaryotic-like serine/threonine-protein kinase
MTADGDDPSPQRHGRHGPGALAGLCPADLMKLGLDTPERIGDYDIIGELGRGGMGAIYRARPRPLGPEVALKVIQTGDHASPEERRRFIEEIKAASVLDHDGIVPIQHVGEHEDLPYYTMPLYAESLDRCMDRFRAPRAAAKLLRTVARAVHHAHTHGVLHRDLKPSNILLDAQGDPYVSDFGIAKRIDEPERPAEQPPGTEQSAVAGTLMYMAPEQSRGDRSVSIKADLYSLGVVLYELLTGHLPIEGDTPAAVKAKLEGEARPDPPSTRAPAVPPDLDAICLKCLEKAPAGRYESAQELADDLSCFLRGKPVKARPAGRVRRAWIFVRHHWFAVSMVAGTISFLAAAVAISTWFATEQELELQHNELRTNAFAAKNRAGAVGLHLREQVDAAVAIAADPAVVQLLRGGRSGGDALERRRARTAFNSLSLMDRSGTAVARAPVAPKNYIGTNYSWRDYFVGARRLGEAGDRTGYVALAFRSEADGYYKFAIGVPVYDASVWIGVLMAAFETNSALGQMGADDEHDVHRTSVLVAPRDGERNNKAVTGEHVVILRDGLVHGSGIPIDPPRRHQHGAPRPWKDQLRWVKAEPLTAGAHKDPLDGFGGRWLAGFAPVGETGFIVIVQTRYAAAVAPTARLWSQLEYLAIAFSAFIVLIGVLVVLLVLRRRVQRPASE